MCFPAPLLEQPFIPSKNYARKLNNIPPLAELSYMNSSEPVHPTMPQNWKLPPHLPLLNSVETELKKNV